MGIKISSLVLAAIIPISSNSGIIAPTAHSRANCFGNNESITWMLGQSFDWRVESHHYPKGWSQPHHIVNTGTLYPWRCNFSM